MFHCHKLGIYDWQHQTIGRKTVYVYGLVVKITNDYSGDLIIAIKCIYRHFSTELANHNNFPL